MYWIATQSVSNNSTTSLNFSSIPQNFTHLQIRSSNSIYAASGAGGSATYLSGINGSVATKHHYYYCDGSGYVSASDSNIPITFCPYSSSPINYGGAIIDIFDYTNTSKVKTIRSISGYDTNTIGVVGVMSVLWNNTAAINQITFGSGGGYFATGTRFDLYGIPSSPITGA